MLKMTFKALYDTNFSDYLNIGLHKVDSYNLRSSVAPTIRVSTIENNTFHDLAASVFNHLPAEVKNITEYHFYGFHLISIYFVIQLRTTTFSSFIYIVIENNV